MRNMVKTTLVTSMWPRMLGVVVKCSVNLLPGNVNETENLKILSRIKTIAGFTAGQS